MSPLLKQYTEVMKLPFNLSFWLISISPDIRQRGCFFSSSLFLQVCEGSRVCDICDHFTVWELSAVTAVHY